MRKLALVGLAATVAVGAYGCASVARNAFAQPVVTLRDVKLQGIGLTGGSFDVVLSVYNPNGYRLDATQLNYNLFVDSLRFANGTLQQQFTVQEKDSTLVRVPVSFSYAGVGEAGRQLLNTGSVNYRVAGEVTVATPVGSFRVPYDRTGRFSTLGGSSR
ncbi:MAG TPA: LEA type 2 family protein [Gemmatimonadaceae bacterium]|nr:LEA type 2 family protein [Gemmatimonadaceae bacterium]